MIEDLVEAILPLFKISGGFTEILYLLLQLAVLAFLVLELLFEEDIQGQRFWSCYCNPSIAIAWPFSTPSSVDFSLAASAWRK
jgi:hypothetical protein